MASVRNIQRSFAGGELSPMLVSRADLDRWRTSLKSCSNMVALPQGGVTKRSGTQRIWEAMDDSVLIPFHYSSSDGYAIEAAAGTFRFFRDYGAVLNDDDTIFELTVPFTADEIEGLCWTQNADVTFMASGARPIQKLSRAGHTSWTIADADITGGPFLDENSDDDIYLYTLQAVTEEGGYAKGESFTLQAWNTTDAAAAEVFTESMVGALMKIKMNIDENGGEYGTWETDRNLAVGTVVCYDDNWYRCVDKHNSDSDTGVNPPTHTSGTRWDGVSTTSTPRGCKWLYLHSGYGIVKITAFNSTSSVEVEVVSDAYVPDEVYASATPCPDNGGVNRWAEGAWSDRRGYPKVVILHQDRLIAACTDYQPSRWWSSQFDDFENFLAGSDDTDGFDRTVMADDEIAYIHWMATGQVLTMGTSGPEFVAMASTNHPRMTPDNAYSSPVTTEGSADIRPVRVDYPVFISRDRLRLLHMLLADNAVDYTCEDLTIFADHITGDGVNGLAWQRDPYRILWSWRDDGQLIGFTYRPDQGVKAWHQHPMTYQGVKSACIVPSSDSIRQDLWMIVERALPAGTKRYIEVMMPFFEKGDLSVENGWFVDCGTRYEGDAATEFDVGSDFEGAALWVLADGKFAGKKTVADGKITLSASASNVLYGLPYTAEIVTLPYDQGTGGQEITSQGGESLGVKTKVTSVALRLRHSVGVSVCASEDEDALASLAIPTGGQNMGSAPTLQTGVFKVDVDGDWDDGGIVRLTSDGPFPMTILSMTPVTQVGGS